MMKQLLIVFTAILFIAGCNTVQGLGRDVSAAGNAVTRSAQ